MDVEKANLLASLREVRRQQRWWTRATFVAFGVGTLLIMLTRITYDLGYLPHPPLAYVPAGVVIAVCFVWWEFWSGRVLGKRRREAALKLTSHASAGVFWPMVSELFVHPQSVDQAVRECIIRLAPWILDSTEVVTPEQCAQYANPRKQLSCLRADDNARLSGASSSYFRCGGMGVWKYGGGSVELRAPIHVPGSAELRPPIPKSGFDAV